MGRPTMSRSIKRQRVREMGEDATEAGHELCPSSAFFSAAGRALAAAPDRKQREKKPVKAKAKKRARK